MNTTDTIPFDVALRLDAAGFNRPSQKYYNIYNKHIFECTTILHREAIWAPTYFEVAVWFKANFNIQIEPNIESILDGLSKIKR